MSDLACGAREIAAGRTRRDDEVVGEDEVVGRRCVTCGDVAEPMIVVRLDADLGLATCVGDDGAQVVVEIALIEPVSTGDRLLVHAGTAIARGEPV